MTDSPEMDRQLEEILAEHRQEEDDASSAERAPAHDPSTQADPGNAVLLGQRREDPDDTEGESEASDPYAYLPGAPIFALFRTVERELGISRIDRIWVFPPRRLEMAETAVVVVAVFPTDGQARRRVFAAHYAVLEDVDEPRLVLQELGTAPTERVGRLVEEAVERLNDAASAPRSHEIQGDPRRWYEVLHGLAEAWLDRVRQPRPGR